MASPTEEHAIRPGESRRLAQPGSGKKILFGWELGGGLGHVNELLSIARELARFGHRPVFAVRNVAETFPVLSGEPYPVLQAPVGTPAFSSDGTPSFADVLVNVGYHSVETLLPRVRGWQGLLDAVRPDLVVSDYSPTLCLTAYGSVPVVTYGNGFTLPPDGPAFPPLVPGRPPLVPAEQILAVVQEVQRRQKRWVPDRLPAIFSADARLLVTIPELDPYQEVRREPYVGPVVPLPEPTPMPRSPRFFAYLTAEWGPLKDVLPLLCQCGFPGAAYVRNIPDDVKRTSRERGLEVLEAPLPPARILEQSTVIVHHGGTGLAQQALAAGRPQFLFPRDLEKVLYADALQRLGVARSFHLELRPTEIIRTLYELLTSPRYAERAQAQAHDLQARGPWNALPRIVERCLALLA